MNKLIILVIGLVAAYAAFTLTFPTYSYRYRLQISLSVEDKVYTGSSIIEVTWSCGPKITGLGQCSSRLGGQATVIDLGSRGVVVATLVNGENDVSARDGATNAQWLCANAFGRSVSNADLPFLPKLTGKRELQSPNLPRLIWFKNPDDPATASKVLPGDFSAAFGEPAQFAGATVELTSDPIVIDINYQLPWIRDWSANYRSRGPLYLKSGLALSAYMFIGDPSQL